MAQLEQCGDDHIDEQLCLSCGCCWQAFVSEFSAEVSYNTRCFLSFGKNMLFAGYLIKSEVIFHTSMTINIFMEPVRADPI